MSQRMICIGNIGVIKNIKGIEVLIWKDYKKLCSLSDVYYIESELKIYKNKIFGIKHLNGDTDTLFTNMKYMYDNKNINYKDSALFKFLKLNNINFEFIIWYSGNIQEVDLINDFPSLIKYLETEMNDDIFEVYLWYKNGNIIN